ncbi:het-domain-containing protein [Ophiostoma piceae UAMH 11346]|uniref:Het-domain-containing protein n=1 Tax=Ophiostoma piceae (strain UAMH 11346) TaxID=1262450 RepID=S3D0J9_OPHP1|nr:het-domain-containing protein [Ophiostoma piceae UAMH 11346]
MTELCAFCSSLDLRFAGYYKPKQLLVEADHDNTGSANQGDEQEVEDARGAEHVSPGSDSDSYNNNNNYNDEDDDDDVVTHEQDVDSHHDCGGPLEEVKIDVISELDSEEGGLNPEEDEYDDEDIYDPYTSMHTVPEMLANSKTCRFCGELTRLFYRWIEETYPGRSTADLFLADSEVEVTQGESIPAAPRPGCDDGENVSRLTSARVKMLMRDPNHPELDNHFYWSGITLAYQRVLWDAWPRLQDVLDTMDAREAEGQSALTAWSENKPYSARHRTGRIDLRLLRRWKEACFAWHGDRCRDVRSHSDSRHDDDSKLESKSTKPQMLRLIDVDNMCLVEVPDRSAVSWVVLSYVWGRVPFFTLTTKNRALLMTEGSFSDYNETADRDIPAFSLPATVADAVDATRGLGERYLWTDSLCIMQDSTDDKALFVPAMDDIYSRATITIVDLGGENAFHGLPGVTKDRFSDRDNFPAPEPFIINDSRIVRASQPTGTGYQRMDMQAGCVYLQRGWTFQEALLSRRFVIFTADTVFWECPCATWREDGNWEVEGEDVVEQVLDEDEDQVDQVHQLHQVQNVAEPPDIFRNSFLTVESTVVYDRLWGPSAEDFNVSYQALVHAFSRRQLSFDRDGLAAFSGVLNALERTTKLETSGAGPKQPPLEFIWGLPGPYLGVALTWPADREEINTLDDQGLPVTDQPPFFYRRTGKCLVFLRSDNNASSGSDEAGTAMTTADVPFPSWSWVGWVGPVLYEELFGSLLSEHAGIRFYVFSATNPNGELVEVPQHTAFQDRWPASKKHVRAPPLWRETSSAGNVVDASVVPEHIRRDSALRQIVLAFWTSWCPRLHVMFEARTQVDDDIVNKADIWEEIPGSTVPPAKFFGSWSQRPPRSWRTGLHVVECVVVGRDNLDNLSEHSRLVLLVTEMVGDEDDELHGTRRRVASLTVDEKAWNALQTRRWEAVVLV